MSTSNISLVLKQALKTFPGRKEAFHQNIETLKALLDKITAADVDLHPQFSEASYWMRERKAPVTYVDIYEDSILTVGIFILKPGMKLPLHDHPGMFGLIKVLTGTLKISSFTIRSGLEKYDRKTGLYAPIVSAERHSDVIADSSSETCILEPVSRNLHEIESIDEPAAFLDILSPPYETESEEFGPRECTYFKVAHHINSKICSLVKIPQPSWFWSDSFPYTGPELVEEKLTQEK